MDEIQEMDMYCSTGHLARFMNVVQGYTDKEELSILINLVRKLKIKEHSIRSISDDIDIKWLRKVKQLSKLS